MKFSVETRPIKPITFKFPDIPVWRVFKLSGSNNHYLKIPDYKAVSEEGETFDYSYDSHFMGNYEILPSNTVVKITT